MNRRRIFKLFHDRFYGERFWRTREEQAWLDVAPVGREFGSPDFERLQVLDLYVAGRISCEDAMRMLGVDSLQVLKQYLDLPKSYPIDVALRPQGLIASVHDHGHCSCV